ncbi:MAG: TlpA family protein disulfide reductase [Phyllobacteriaceae bacterium]|nr:TlpA family protein disulfide reductase [Phyllobacteriaceae bacterium]
MAAVAVLAAFGLARVYGIGGLGGNEASAGKCAAAPAAAARLAPYAVGDLAGLAPTDAGRDLSDLVFHDENGAPIELSAWKGRTVLLNLWATWCPPCRAEMPSLDLLQAKLGSKDFEVVTVNMDTRDPERPKAFLADIGVKALTHRADPSMCVFKALQKLGLARGLPTTVLVDRSGCELATLAGPAHWDGEAATALVEAALKP